jgi:effector-binding domain-containing protein
MTCNYRQNVFNFKDADLEACMPVRKPKAEVPGISIRELPGGRCVSLMHKGPGMIFKGNPKKYQTEIQIVINNKD